MDVSLDELRWLMCLGITAVQRSRYCITAAWALQVYEWLLTLGEEYRLIHCARWTSIKIAYLICRYYPLFAYPILMWFWLGDHDETFCRSLVHPVYALLVPFQMAAQAVMLMRAYAFTGRNKVVLVVLCVCYLALFAAEMWLFTVHFTLVGTLFLILGKSGCFANDSEAETGGMVHNIPSTWTGVVILSAFCLDFLAMALVFLHCIRIRSTQGPLGKTFLKQGLGAFAVMSGLNLMVASIYIGRNRLYDGFGLPMLLVVPDILACRLILLLRAKVLPTERKRLQEQSRVVRECLAASEPFDENGTHITHSLKTLDYWVC